MFFPIYLLSAAGFTVLTTEFVIVGLLPAIARDLAVTIPRPACWSPCSPSPWPVSALS